MTCRRYEDRPTGLLGCDYKIENGRYRFARIYDGENWNPGSRAPLTQPGVNVQEGEYLLAVNGRELRAADNVYSFFEATSGKKVGSGSGQIPTAAARVTSRSCRSPTKRGCATWPGSKTTAARSIEATKGRVAYVYMPDTAFGGLTNFTRYFYAQVGKEAVIIDERFNGGGALATDIIEQLNRKMMSLVATRDGEDEVQPQGAIFGPKVMIINEFAGSGGDAMPNYFRRAGVGKLIGKRTWGGLVGRAGAPPLMDGGFVTAPSSAVWGPNGEWDAENVGIAPDIEVEHDPELVRKGSDPQLEKAIEVVMAELEKNPVPKPKRPAYPNVSQEAVDLETRDRTPWHSSLDARSFRRRPRPCLAPRPYCVGAIDLLAGQQTTYSARAVNLVAESTVVDLLNQFLFPDFAERPPKSERWLRQPGVMRAEDAATYLDSGIDVFGLGHGAGTYEQALRFFAEWNGFLADYADWFMRIDEAADFERVRKARKVGVMLTFQDSTHFRTPEDVTTFWGMGQRISQLTYNFNNRIGSGFLEHRDGGLSVFGASILHKMNEVGMAADLSHCADQTTLDAIAVAKKPIVFTHATCRAVAPGLLRAKTDEAIKGMARTGGVMGVAFIRFLVRAREPVTIEHALDHIDHIVKLVGVEHAAIGSDLDLVGNPNAINGGTSPKGQPNFDRYQYHEGPNGRITIEGLDHPKRMFDVAEGLIRRGYTDDHIRLILGGNAVRTLTAFGVGSLLRQILVDWATPPSGFFELRLGEPSDRRDLEAAQRRIDCCHHRRLHFRGVHASEPIA